MTAASSTTAGRGTHHGLGWHDLHAQLGCQVQRLGRLRNFIADCSPLARKQSERRHCLTLRRSSCFAIREAAFRCSPRTGRLRRRPFSRHWRATSPPPSWETHTLSRRHQPQSEKHSATGSRPRLEPCRTPARTRHESRKPNTRLACNRPATVTRRRQQRSTTAGRGTSPRPRQRQPPRARAVVWLSSGYASPVTGWPAVLKRAPASGPSRQPASSQPKPRLSEAPLPAPRIPQHRLMRPRPCWRIRRNAAIGSPRPARRRSLEMRRSVTVADRSPAAESHQPALRTSMRPAVSNSRRRSGQHTAAIANSRRGPRSAHSPRWRGRVVLRGNNTRRTSARPCATSAGPCSAAWILRTHNTGANLQPVPDSNTTTTAPKLDSRPWYSPRPRQRRPRRAARLSGSAPRYAASLLDTVQCVDFYTCQPISPSTTISSRKP